MRAATLSALGVVLALAAPARAAKLHGLVYDDADGDRHPSAGERGVAGAIVAFGVDRYATTDARGQFELVVPDDARGIVWVRVPDGYRPGPVWAQVDDPDRDVDLALHRLASPIAGPLTFVVAADSHLSHAQAFFGMTELASAVAAATALDPPPAFFTILGDITQGSNDADYELVDRALDGLAVPWIPVPGNHDWYDSGEAWFRRYGPDNYSFDLGGVHFVVWNMAMSEDDIRAYLGAELSRVAHGMPIVALTHEPPSPAVVDTLRELGVDYVLTGHTHSNRVVDHHGVIELNTEPLIMGGLDFTPAGYRVVTIDAGRLTSYHRTTVDAPYLAVVAPARGQCVRPSGGELVVAAELDAGDSVVTARVDCATPIALRADRGWTWRLALPALDPGGHELAIEARAASGTVARTTATIEVCEPGPPPAPSGADWPQLGGDAAHVGARARELAPPLVARWTATVGGHIVTAAPAIANGTVYAVATDLGDGGGGGIVALDLVTGASRWRTATPVAVRGGVAVVGKLVVATQIDGVVLGLDADTGRLVWRYELSADFAPQAGAVFAAPTADAGELLVGHKRALVALTATGTPRWVADPVPDGKYSQSLAAIAAAGGVAIGVFDFALGGVSAWDRETGEPLWRVAGDGALAINASPVIAGDTVYLANGLDQVLALDVLTGHERWRAALDPMGFAWGIATVGAPALARGVLVVPTLWRDLVGLDATTGVELWRHAGEPSAIHATHYRGAREAGFAASPVITGDVVWAAGTDGVLRALELRTGDELWRTALGAPVLAGLAASGDWLVVASYDGSVHAFVPTPRERPLPGVARCAEPVATGGCCDGGGESPGAALVMIAIVAAATRRRRR